MTVIALVDAKVGVLTETATRLATVAAAADEVSVKVPAALSDEIPLVVQDDAEMLPLRLSLLRTVVVPDVAPMVSAVAAPAKFTVVAVALIRSNDALPVVSEVVIAGEVPNTREPLPVSSEMTPASSAEVVAAKTESLFAV